MFYKFPCSERLKNPLAISALFEEGNSFSRFPVRVVYSSSPSEIGCLKVAFSVSKKYYRRANKRNLVKRRLREIYRLNIETLRKKCQETKTELQILFLYLDSKNCEYEYIKSSMLRIFEEFISRLEKMPNVEKTSTN